MIPTFKYTVRCGPEGCIGDEICRIMIQDERGFNLSQAIRLEDLKDKSLNDYLWNNMKEIFEKNIQRGG